MKTRVGPRNHVLDGGAGPQGLGDHAAEGIIQYARQALIVLGNFWAHAMRQLDCLTWLKSDIYDCFVVSVELTVCVLKDV